MRHSRRIGRVAAVVMAATVAVAMAAPVAAAPLDQGTFHDEFSFIDPDFCGTGLEVQFDVVVDGQFLVTRRGRDGLVYFMEHIHRTDTITNPANGRTITDDERTVSKGSSTSPTTGTARSASSSWRPATSRSTTRTGAPSPATRASSNSSCSSTTTAPPATRATTRNSRSRSSRSRPAAATTLVKRRCRP